VRNVLLVVGAVLLFCVAAMGAWAWSFTRQVNEDLTASVTKDPQIRRALTKAPPKPEKPFTMLLLGADMVEKNEPRRTDTIILARVDPTQKKAWLLSIPRDTKVDIPGYGTRKINQAYQYGGPALTIKAVQNLTGVPVNHYMEVGFYGFRHLVEVLGGVHVNVDTYINDPKAARANPGHRGSVIKPGYQKLDADQALVYVRSRAFPDADFSRMRHQQTFFKALAKEASATRNLPRLPAFVRNVARTVKTDMQLGLMLRLATELRGIPDKNIQTATLEGEWRTPYVYTDEAKAKQLIGNMMAGRDFKPASNPKDVVPSQFKVVVRNGSGISGLAATVSGQLRALGFKIGEVGNAKRQDYSTTLIIYRGDYAGVAKRVRESLRRGKLVNDASNRYDFEGDVMVVVGRDWRSAETSAAAAAP
jgi:LCP family protein required for cell wall assembly